MKLKSDNLFLSNKFPKEVSVEITEDVKDLRKAVLHRLPTNSLFTSWAYGPYMFAHVLGRWCIVNGDSATKISKVDIYDYSKFIKQDKLINDDELREFYRNIILFGLFENLECPLRYDMSAQDQLDLGKLLFINAATHNYFNDSICFVEFDYADFYNSIKVYYASGIVVDRNHFTYDYIQEGATEPTFSVHIKGNKIYLLNKDRCYFYSMPYMLVEDLTYLNKMNSDMVYSIVSSMVNKMFNAEPIYNRDTEILKLFYNNENMIREGISNYYKRLYKAAHLYYHKEKESDIYPVG